jgi:hypothetical protein
VLQHRQRPHNTDALTPLPVRRLPLSTCNLQFSLDIFTPPSWERFSHCVAGSYYAANTRINPHAPIATVSRVA